MLTSLAAGGGSMARSSPLWPSAPGAILRYAVALLAVAAAAVVGLLLGRFLQTAPTVSLFLLPSPPGAILRYAGARLAVTGPALLAFFFYLVPPTAPSPSLFLFAVLFFSVFG